jgi:hypothetical protein
VVLRFGLVQSQLPRTFRLALSRVLMTPRGHAEEFVGQLTVGFGGAGVPLLSACGGRMARPRLYLAFDLTTRILSAAFALL